MCYDESEFCLQFASDGKCINSALHKIANFCKKACGLCGRCQHGSAAWQTPTPSHTLCTKDSSSAKYSSFDIVETTASISTKLCTTIRTIQPSAPHGWSKYASNKYKIADCRKFEKKPPSSGSPRNRYNAARADLPYSFQLHFHCPINHISHFSKAFRSENYYLAV